MVQDFGRPLNITVRPIYGTAVLSACLSVCNVGVLWPNGYIKMPLGTEIGLGPGDIVLDGYPAPPRKGAQQPPSLFGSRLLWPNGWMDEDATWYGGRPWPRQLCVQW